MDLVDTLAQKFGIKMGSVEKEIMKFSDALVPGASPYVMRGILDRAFGGTISTRLGFSDLIPLTGVFKAGADPWREAENFVGPVYSRYPRCYYDYRCACKVWRRSHRVEG